MFPLLRQFLKMNNKLLALSILPILLIILLYNQNYDPFCINVPKNKINLFIGVLSARENFSKRDALRKAWLKDIPSTETRAFFFVGNQDCFIHNDNLKDPYSCQLYRHNETSVKQEDLKSYKESLEEKFELKRQLNIITTNKLILESETYKDIKFLNMVDIYRNLPLKVLNMIEMASILYDYNYLMKVDDDGYVNIAKIVDSLKTNPLKEKTWWGKKYWALDSYGKWAEHEYLSATYPPFACGSGYILTKELTNWLIRNKDELYSYQGEDVSLGIWLAAIKPNYKQDFGWLCDQSEFSHIDNTLVLPQLTNQQLENLETFNRYKNKDH